MQYNARTTKWNRVSPTHPCPICGKPDWCLTAGRADHPEAAICCRVESAKRVGTEDAGWLHRLCEVSWRPRRRHVKISAPPPTIDFSEMAGECFRALGRLGRSILAAKLRVTVESLDRLGVGWSERDHAYTFPMRDATCADVCCGVRGIRLRGTDGDKWSVKGGHEGLFLPYLRADDHLLICEGPTDCAALLDLNFEAVGRPSCSGGVRLSTELVKCGDWQEVVIVADADPPGQRGARNLAAALVAYASAVRIILPPAGVKDAREWKRQGATHDDVLAAIQAAPPLRLDYSRKAVAR